MLHPRYPKTNQFVYCLDTYVIRDKNCISKCCTNGNLPEKIKIAWEAGYDAVELWHPDLEDYVKHGHSLAELKSILEKYNLQVPSYKVIDNWLEVNDFTFNNNLNKIRNTLVTASAIGAKSCILKMIHHTFNGVAPTKQECIRRYLKILEIAEPLNIKPSLEFMGDAPCWNTINSVMSVLKEVQHPLACLVLDTFHLFRSGDNNFLNFEQAINEIGLNPDQVSVIHFTDTRKDVPREKQTDSDRRLPGVGQLDLHKFVTILHKIKFNGALSLNVYDQNLWNRPPMEVATEGYYRMATSIENFTNLADSAKWKGKQRERCLGLWAKGNRHLDPRLETNDRETILLKHLEPYLKDKIVLDFKCGFSPLAKYVSVGFDAFEGCISYLKKHHPDKKWVCKTDEDFANSFKEKIDVLLHIGLGDSNTEIESNLKIRRNCNPKMVIIECCADKNGRPDESKPGATQRWEMLKQGLKGREVAFKTNMSNRSDRLMFIGEALQ